MTKRNPYAAPKVPEPEPAPKSDRKCLCDVEYTCAWHLYGQDRQACVPSEVRYNILNCPG